MRIPGLKTLKRSAIQFKKRFVNGALILGYHRIADTAYDPYNICVTPHHFSEQLEVLRRVAHIISLNELVNHIKSGEFPRRTVVLTFDDGYLDYLNEVLPRLERLQTPATLFVAAGYLGQELWWDRLSRLIYDTASIPEELSLRSESGQFNWKIPQSALKTHGNLSVNARQDLVRTLYDLLLKQPTEMKVQLIAQLENQVGMRSNSIPATRLLAEEELVQLAGSGLVEVGAHSVNHPLLASLPESEQRFEIEHSKSCLELILKQEVNSFSYPNGSMSQTTISLVEKAGYTSACGSFNNIVWHDSDLFHLPRLWVPNIDGAGFSDWLRRWSR
jgi:peptidoglycan/xylan/chitin deacetylase (PgdA/CDA1 family)